jgi:hypothetical protein
MALRGISSTYIGRPHSEITCLGHKGHRVGKHRQNYGEVIPHAGKKW